MNFRVSETFLCLVSSGITFYFDRIIRLNNTDNKVLMAYNDVHDVKIIKVLYDEGRGVWFDGEKRKSAQKTLSENIAKGAMSTLKSSTVIGIQLFVFILYVTGQ